MRDEDRANVLAAEIARALSHAGPNGHDNQPSDGETDWVTAASWLSEDPHIAGALRIELSKVEHDPPPVKAPEASPVFRGRTGKAARQWAARLLSDPHALAMLSALVLEDVDDEQVEPGRRGDRKGRLRQLLGKVWDGWLKRSSAVIWMQVLILTPVVVTFFTVWGGIYKPTADHLGIGLLKLFTVWVLSFVPSWLYVRFLGQRAGALWSEFVIYLHRLRWDDPKYLPRPPKASRFYQEWLDQRGYLEHPGRNLYRQKFNAYYGRAVSTANLDTDFAVTAETMFPVFLCTLVMSTSWVAVLWDPGFAQHPDSVWDILKFGFLGAYAFTFQSLIRRFFQSDLRPSAYAAAILRLILVFTTLLALYQLMTSWGFSPGMQAIIAFVVGGFPLVGVYALHRAAALALRVAVPQLTPPYPLSQIDGLNVWYEARLLEEGIEDMENLATANLVDVILHTRVPVGRLVDWVDQAYLYLHLDRMEVTHGERRRARKGQSDPTAPDLGASLGPNARAGTETRTQLRQFGIRTATDLLKAFPPTEMDPHRSERPLPDGFDSAQIRTLVRVLDQETGLAPIWNWQKGDVQLKRPEPDLLSDRP